MSLNYKIKSKPDENPIFSTCYLDLKQSNSSKLSLIWCRLKDFLFWALIFGLFILWIMSVLITEIQDKEREERKIELLERIINKQN